MLCALTGGCIFLSWKVSTYQCGIVDLSIDTEIPTKISYYGREVV